MQAIKALSAVVATAGLAIAFPLFSPTVYAGDLVKYQIVGEDSIPKPLTGEPGDVKRGRKLALNRKKGNCLACHVITDLKSQPFHGKIAPPLDGVAERWKPGQIRLRVVNSKKINRDTIMPAFYKNDGFHRLLKKFKGKTVLSAQEVEDIVAYMSTLKEK